MTRKEKQKNINSVVDIALKDLTEELQQVHGLQGKRLRTCTAWVYETPRYYVLESYNTIVACIFKENDTCYDFLRKVYGYTHTSAQHIAKFRHDYGQGKHGCENELRYYDI